jgi:hypothetical protein
MINVINAWLMEWLLMFVHLTAMVPTTLLESKPQYPLLISVGSATHLPIKIAFMIIVACAPILQVTIQPHNVPLTAKEFTA